VIGANAQAAKAGRMPLGFPLVIARSKANKEQSRACRAEERFRQGIAAALQASKKEEKACCKKRIRENSFIQGGSAAGRWSTRNDALS
jgi:hypothetical protein